MLEHRAFFINGSQISHKTQYKDTTIYNVGAHSFFINGSQISQTKYIDITIYNVEAHSCFYKWQSWEEPGFVMCQLWNLYGGSGGRSFKHSQLSDTKCQSLLFEILEFPEWWGKRLSENSYFFYFSMLSLYFKAFLLTYSQNCVLTKPMM